MKSKNEFLKEVIEYETMFSTNHIGDGVVDAATYFDSNIKIAWFLKEAYTDEAPGFHMREHYGQENAYEYFFKSHGIPTWHPIIYCSYGILNNFLKWDDMDYIRNKPEMCNVINSIAIINVNKEPSKTGTYTLSKNLDEAFSQSKPIIDLQLKVLQPRVHIFGGTAFLYKEYFNLEDRHRVKSSTNSFEKDGNLYIEAYHPANRSNKRNEYVDRIIEDVQRWALKNQIN